jgi:hypothetical protein
VDGSPETVWQNLSPAKNNCTVVPFLEVSFLIYPEEPVWNKEENGVKNIQIDMKEAGVILMEVLPLLTLFGITAMVFVFYSTTGR